MNMVLIPFLGCSDSDPVAQLLGHDDSIKILLMLQANMREEYGLPLVPMQSQEFCIPHRLPHHLPRLGSAVLLDQQLWA